MSNVIAMHTTKHAKSAGVMCAAMLLGHRLGLSAIQCEALARKARQDYERGRSPARAVADARVAAREVAERNLA